MPEKEIRYFSKSNLKSKCRYGYKYGRSQSVYSIMGCALHYLIALYLSDNNVNIHDNINIVCDKFSVPSILKDDLINSFNQWLYDISEYIINSYTVIAVESNDSSSYKYEKKIIYSDLDNKYGLYGMLDFVGRHKKSNKIFVWDWKSGMLPSDADFEAICNGVLAYLYYKEPIKSVIYSIGSRTSERTIINDGNINECINIIMDRIESILRLEANGELKKTPNEYCFSCSCKFDCEKYADIINGIPYMATANKNVDDINDIDLINEISRLKIIYSNVKKELDRLNNIAKSRLQARDIIDSSSGYKYTLNTYNTKAYDGINLLKALHGFGLSENDINNLIKISKSKVDKLLIDIKKDNGPDVYKAAKLLIKSMEKEGPSSSRIKKQLLMKL